MRKLALLLPLLFVLTFPLDLDARIKRSSKARNDFKKENPCPATGKTSGACPGWTIDHRIAICVGGEDSASNMRWMTEEAAKEKDKWECKPGWKERLKEEAGNVP